MHIYYGNLELLYICVKILRLRWEQYITLKKKLTFMLLVSFPIHDHLHLYNKTLHI